MSEKPLTTTTIEVRVRYGETDQMGVAYHAHYLVYCELARTEHMRRLGVRYRDLEERGFKLAVSEASLRYARAARYDDLLKVTAWLAAVGSRRVVFRYRVERAEDGDLLCTAETALVSLDAGNRPTRLPDEVLRIMKSLVRDE
ncbi:MAG: acyl-CoA thioesterase [Gemmatimonadales bacterium]